MGTREGAEKKLSVSTCGFGGDNRTNVPGPRQGEGWGGTQLHTHTFRKTHTQRSWNPTPNTTLNPLGGLLHTNTHVGVCVTLAYVCSTRCTHGT